MRDERERRDRPHVLRGDYTRQLVGHGGPAGDCACSVSSVTAPQMGHSAVRDEVSVQVERKTKERR